MIIYRQKKLRIRMAHFYETVSGEQQEAQVHMCMVN